MLFDITKRYSFLDRSGNSLNLDRSTALDQYGKKHQLGTNDLTSVVIISAERGNGTKRCVESIFQNTTEPFEIILSDVGSGRETLEIIMASRTCTRMSTSYTTNRVRAQRDSAIRGFTFQGGNTLW